MLQKLFLLLSIITIIIIIAVSCTAFGKDNFVSELSQDGKKYQVRAEGTPQDRKESANFLSKISNKVDKLVLYMKDFNLPNSTSSQRLYKRWSRCWLKETSSHEKTAAYTVNKGEELRLCVRSPKTKLIENENTAIFVVLHELAHLMSVSYGHNQEFQQNFLYIVELASGMGIYLPENFGHAPQDYCGTIITTTPCDSGTCDYATIPTSSAYLSKDDL